MLDKSVPYAGFYMHRKAGTEHKTFAIPDGYRFAMYDDGDEKDWARIETSVLEFDSEFSALLHFTENFLPYIDELKNRCLFIETEDSFKIATATAWWRVIENERRTWMHWIAVDPEYQGLGLGKAIVSRIMEIMTDLDGDTDFFLGTQTWSYKAVSIYKLHGFEPTDEKVLYTDRNHSYKKAMRILKKLRK